MKPLRLLILIMLNFFLAGCVSVKLTPDVPKANKISVTSPGLNFEERSLPPADRAWKSRQTGNTISYFSDCAQAPITLERIREDVLLSMQSSKVTSSNMIEYDDREALDSMVDGKLEGIPVRMSLLSYQKNGCRYTLAYTGRNSLFEQELAEFQRFKKGFSAP